jgi:Zn-dependent protease with chaperone function
MVTIIVRDWVRPVIFRSAIFLAIALWSGFSKHDRPLILSTTTAAIDRSILATAPNRNGISGRLPPRELPPAKASSLGLTRFALDRRDLVIVKNDPRSIPTAMNREQVTALVQKLEIFARKKPNRYKFWVWLLALLGYLYILLVLVGLGLLIAILLGAILYSHRLNAAIVKLLLLFSIPVFMILRSLWEALSLKFSPPEGLELSRAETPHLFEVIDRLRTSLQCPPFDRVRLTTDYNAAVVQIPRLGFLGWGETYLLLGLPLLQSLSVQGFTAVLAHEFGHLSGNHSRFKGWIYRLRQTWSLLFDRVAGGREGGGFGLFEAFFRWYIPFFNAYSFVLARSDEYEADRCAMQLVGREPTASALIHVNVRAQWMESHFWKPLYQRVVSESDPPGQPFTALGELIQIDIPDDQARKWLEQALNIPTDLADTHPCLSDRLLAIGCDPREASAFLVPVTETAADALLGSALVSLTERLNERWRRAVTFQWQEEYTRSRVLQERLQVLDHQALYRTLLIEEAWEQARLTAQVKGYETALPLLRSLLQRDAHHTSANLLLGQILLYQQDETGIEHLEKAMSKDPAIVIESCQMIADFLQVRGRSLEGRYYRQRAETHYENLQKANEERAIVRPNDRFTNHGLSFEKIADFSHNLVEYHEIRTAYLVRKVVNTFPDIPFYVLGILRHKERFEWDSYARDRRLVDHLAATLSCPGQTWIVILNASNRGLARSLRNVPNSLIYS